MFNPFNFLGALHYENLCALGQTLINDKIKQSPIALQKVETKPRIPYLAEAGTLTAALQGVRGKDCEQVEIVSAFPYYDFTIYAHGDSMLPEIKSRDELACRTVKDKNEL